MGMSSVEADRMRTLAAEAAPHLVAESVEWNRNLAAHHARLTEAVRWLIARGDATAAVEMVANLRRYGCDERHHADARDLPAAAVAIDEAPHAQPTRRASAPRRPLRSAPGRP